MPEPMPQPEDYPFCFFLRHAPLCVGPGVPAEDAHHAFHRVPLQKRLVPGQEHTARKVGALCQQGFQPKTHGVVATWQSVEKARHAPAFAQRLHLRRAGDDHPGSELRRIGGGQRPAKQRLALGAKGGQQFIGAKPGGEPRRHDDAPDGQGVVFCHKKSSFAAAKTAALSIAL